MRLINLLFSYVESNNLGEVYPAPLDVELDKFNIYQPDILFVSKARKEILQERVKGAPDFVVEILSQNKKHDLGEKMEGYGKFGVKEYWVIDPENKTLIIYQNKDGEMKEVANLTKEDTAVSNTIPGFEVALSQLF